MSVADADPSTAPSDLPPEVVERRLAVAREAARYGPETALDEEHLRTLALVGTIELGSALTAGMDATLQRIVDLLHPNLHDVRGLSVILWAPELGRFTTSASTVPDQPPSEAVRRVRRRGATSWIVEHREPLCVNDVDEDPFGANPMLQEWGSYAYSGVPILQDGEAVGVLYAMAGSRGRFSPADVRFLATIADRCAVVIRTARASERTQQLLARAQELASITGTLAGLDPLDQRLDEVVRRLAPLLGGTVELEVSTPDLSLRRASGPDEARRTDEREIGVTAGGDGVRVHLRLRPGRSSPSDQEIADVLHTVADQIGLAAARDHASAALQQSNEALEQFAHVASHDLKSPLASVIGFLDLVLATEGDALPDRAKMLLQRALSGGHRMREIIDALLAYAKIQDDDPERALTPLGDLVGQVLGVLVTPIEDSGATVTVGDDLPLVLVDPAAFRIVIQNLVSNALKFVPEGEAPIVDVDARERPDGAVELTVTDQGIGVSEADRERVFELFERGSSRHRGTGIGLATVKRIVDSHGGEVWLEPNQPVGTRVVVRIPPD